MSHALTFQSCYVSMGPAQGHKTVTPLVVRLELAKYGRQGSGIYNAASRVILLMEVYVVVSLVTTA